MPNLVLIGMPGCGKSYWGNLLSNELNIPFYDLDDIIEKEAGRKIAQIFAEHGESYFRDLESLTLNNFLNTPPENDYILACGGGTPAYKNNMTVINAKAKSLFLDVTIPKIITQLTSDRQSNRPLLKTGSAEQLIQILQILREKRLAHYTQAQFSVSGSDIHIDNLKEIYFYE